MVFRGPPSPDSGCGQRKGGGSREEPGQRNQDGILQPLPSSEDICSISQEKMRPVESRHGKRRVRFQAMHNGSVLLGYV